VADTLNRRGAWAPPQTNASPAFICSHPARFLPTLTLSALCCPEATSCRRNVVAALLPSLGDSYEPFLLLFTLPSIARNLSEENF